MVNLKVNPDNFSEWRIQLPEDSSAAFWPILFQNALLHLYSIFFLWLFHGIPEFHLHLKRLPILPEWFSFADEGNILFAADSYHFEPWIEYPFSIQVFLIRYSRISKSLKLFHANRLWLITPVFP